MKVKFLLTLIIVSSSLLHAAMNQQNFDFKNPEHVKTKLEELIQQNKLSDENISNNLEYCANGKFNTAIIVFLDNKACEKFITQKALVKVLEIASQNENVDLIRALLVHPISNKLLKSARLANCLHFAAQKKNKEIICILLNHPSSEGWVTFDDLSHAQTLAKDREISKFIQHFYAEIDSSLCSIM